VSDKTDQERAMIYLSACLFAAERVEELYEGIYRESVEAREEAANRLRAVRDGDANAIAETIETMAWVAEGQQ